MDFTQFVDDDSSEEFRAICGRLGPKLVQIQDLQNAQRNNKMQQIAEERRLRTELEEQSRLKLELEGQYSKQLIKETNYVKIIGMMEKSFDNHMNYIIEMTSLDVSSASGSPSASSGPNTSNAQNEGSAKRSQKNNR